MQIEGEDQKGRYVEETKEGANQKGEEESGKAKDVEGSTGREGKAEARMN